MNIQLLLSFFNSCISIYLEIIEYDYRAAVPIEDHK